VIKEQNNMKDMTFILVAVCFHMHRTVSVEILVVWTGIWNTFSTGSDSSVFCTVSVSAIFTIEGKP